MSSENLIRNIVTLPTTFKTVGKSTITLLKESGYHEKFDSIDEGDIADILREYPSAIEDWMIWSKDKRTSSGWYFNKESENDFVVGFYPHGLKGDLLHFSDKISGCAAFIKREIESIRLLTI
jgi:hypothetical protein